jgi:hypothetical protein
MSNPEQPLIVAVHALLEKLRNLKKTGWNATKHSCDVLIPYLDMLRRADRNFHRAITRAFK